MANYQDLQVLQSQIVSKEDLYVQVKLVSGEIRLVNKNCLATVGSKFQIQIIKTKN